MPDSYNVTWPAVYYEARHRVKSRAYNWQRSYETLKSTYYTKRATVCVRMCACARVYVCETCVKCLPGEMEFDEKILRGVGMFFVSSRIYKKKKERKYRIN